MRRVLALFGTLLLALALFLHLSNEAENALARHRSGQLRVRLLERSDAKGTDEPEPFLGILSIPALQLELPVQSGWDEERLKDSPCRFSGSQEEGNLVIMAHNYRAHFGPIRRLKPDDQVIFTDLSGRTTLYRVTASATVEADDTGAVTNSGYDLTLFTCTYGGRNRLAVFCTAEPSE